MAKTVKEPVYKTFMEWVNSGRGVRKGEKAAYFSEVIIDGKTKRVAFFEKKQTLRLKVTYVDPALAIRAYYKRDGYYGAEVYGVGIPDPRKIFD